MPCKKDKGINVKLSTQNEHGAFAWHSGYKSAPSGLDHGGYSTGKGDVTRNLHLVDLPEISHPMIVLQQVSIVDCNLEVVRFHQDLYLENKYQTIR